MELRGEVQDFRLHLAGLASRQSGYPLFSGSLMASSRVPRQPDSVPLGR